MSVVAFPAEPAAYRGAPSFYRACCREASFGGSSGYDRAGYQLSRTVFYLCPISIEDADWRALVERELEPLVEERSSQRILEWLTMRFPRCMQLVPKRRRELFLKGFYSAMA